MRATLLEAQREMGERDDGYVYLFEYLSHMLVRMKSLGQAMP